MFTSSIFNLDFNIVKFYIMSVFRKAYTLIHLLEFSSQNKKVNKIGMCYSTRITSFTVTGSPLDENPSIEISK